MFIRIMGVENLRESTTSNLRPGYFSSSSFLAVRYVLYVALIPEESVIARTSLPAAMNCPAVSSII